MAVSTQTAERDAREWRGVGAFLCGVATGAALAILFAPARGRETRDRLLAKAREGGVRIAKYADLGKLEGELEAWAATIDALKARVNQTTGDVRDEYEQRIANLQARLEAARHALEQLRTGGEAAGQELRSGADRAWSELRTAVERAVSELR